MSTTASASRFQFVGVAPFVDRAASVLGLTDDRLKGKARSIEHLGRIQTALGQASQAELNANAAAPGSTRQAIFDQAVAFRHSLAVALLAAELAIVDVAQALALEVPSFAELDFELASAHQQGKTARDDSTGSSVPRSSRSSSSR